MGKLLFTRKTILYLLLFQGYLSNLEAVRLKEQKQTKHLETELHRAHLQVQYSSAVTSKPPGDWDRNP